MRPAWHLQDGVVGEEAHHRVQVVGVEGGEQVLERLDGCLARACHLEHLRLVTRYNQRTTRTLSPTVRGSSAM
jgi:hypothetical protein